MVATSGIVTSVVGVPVLLLLTAVWGSVGAVAAILIAEAVSTGIQLGALLRDRLRRRPALLASVTHR